MNPRARANSESHDRVSSGIWGNAYSHWIAKRVTCQLDDSGHCLFEKGYHWNAHAKLWRIKSFASSRVDSDLRRIHQRLAGLVRIV